jgi:hypothetical protein
MATAAQQIAPGRHRIERLGGGGDQAWFIHVADEFAVMRLRVINEAALQGRNLVGPIL